MAKSMTTKNKAKRTDSGGTGKVADKLFDKFIANNPGVTEKDLKKLLRDVVQAAYNSAMMRVVREQAKRQRDKAARAHSVITSKRGKK